MGKRKKIRRRKRKRRVPPREPPIDHDGSYCRIFSHAKTAEDLIRVVLEEEEVTWLDAIDFNSLAERSNDFVSDKSARRRGDYVWQVTIDAEKDEELREIAGETNELYFLIALEFQSRIDRDMPVRISSYRAMIRQRLAERNGGKPIPEVLPIVIYNGDKPWDADRKVKARLIRPLPGLEKYRAEGSYALVEMRRPEIANQPVGNVLGILASLEQAKDWKTVREIVEARCEELIGSPVEGDLIRWLLGTLSRYKKGFNTEYPRPVNIREVKSMLAEKVARWGEEDRRVAREEGWQEGIEKGIAKGIEKGIEKGREEGREEGMQQGRAEAFHEAIIGFMTSQFDELPRELERKISAVTDTDTLRRLVRRMGMVNSLDEFESELG